MWEQGEPALVFLHYFGGAAASWQWVVEHLASYRCVALDLPGFGDAAPLAQSSLGAYATAVEATLAELGVAEYVLIGHSMGGKIALAMAARQSPGLQRLILIAPSPATQEPMPAEEKQRMLEHHPSRENAETTLANAARQPLSQEQRELAIGTHMAPDDGAWRWWLTQGMEHSIAEAMTRIAVPVAVIASQDDPVIPYEAIQRDVIDIVPGAQLICTQGLGHLMPLEAPGWVAEQIRSVLD